MGIQGNDSAAAAGKGASERPEEPIPINDSDWRNVIRMHYLHDIYTLSGRIGKVVLGLHVRFPLRLH